MQKPEGGNPIDVTDARKRFGAVEALAGASFQVRRGELIGLLGPNGAGKTTMIRAIAGRVALDSGEIRVFGRVVGTRDPRPEIGVVPQELAVYGLLNARENLEVFANSTASRTRPSRNAWTGRSSGPILPIVRAIA